MKRTISFLVAGVLVLVTSFPVFAAGDPLADLRAAVLQDDYATASTLAQALAKRSLAPPEAQEVRYFLALCALRLGDYARAERLFHALVGERPALPLRDRAFAGYIDALYLQGRYDVVQREAASFLARRRTADTAALVALRMARASLKLARWKKAREQLQRVIDDYPGSFEAGAAQRLLEERQYFTVQVGSFTEQARAGELVRDLVGRGEYAYIVEMKSAEGRTYYRVRVGQLAALKDAQTLEQKLSGLGYPTLIYP